MADLLYRTIPRRLSCFQLILTFAVLCAGGIGGAVTAWAGNPVDELAYRYPCLANRQKIAIEGALGHNRPTVGVELDFGGTPRLAVNEQDASKQPIEVVAFEYFAACEAARQLMFRSAAERRKLLDEPRSSVRLLNESDCRAIGVANKNGLLNGEFGIDTILKVFRYQKAKQYYLGATFQQRADHISRECRL